MNSHFVVFGPGHLLIIVAVPFVAAGLAWWSRRRFVKARRIRWWLGGILLTNEIVSYVYRLDQGWIHFPYGLPLHLCDVAIWLTIFALFTVKPWVVDLAYYWTLAGTSMAVLTPDLSVPFPSVAALQFFVSHGGAVTGMLMLVLSKQVSPRPGSAWKVLGISCAYATGIAVFNWVFKTNYMYLCEKPVSVTLLDLLGPWPAYIGSGLILAGLLFFLLSLPFRSAQQAPNARVS